MGLLSVGIMWNEKEHGVEIQFISEIGSSEFGVVKLLYRKIENGLFDI